MMIDRRTPRPRFTAAGPGLPCLFALFALSVLFALPGVASVDETAIRAHVEELASEKLEGRLTGTEGELLAVAYVEGELRKIGAKPIPGHDSLRHPFPFTAGMSDGGSSLVLRPTADDAAAEQRWDTTADVQALSFSDDGTISGSVVFAGYGLTVPEGQDHGYDSYVGLDVKDKIVLALRYFPEEVDGEQRAILSRFSGLRYKAMRARERGAKALILVTGPHSPNAGETIPMAFDTALSGSGILAASVSGRVADRILQSTGRNLDAVQASFDDGNPHVTGFDVPDLTLTLETAVVREKRTGQNVIGYLPAATKGEADGSMLVLGAHLDHLGRGKHGNSLARKEEAGDVHLGADDNASGVAAILEAGRKLAGEERRRPVILGFWSGEELGLLGSTAFLEAFEDDPERLFAYLNFDMVGRMKDNRLNLQGAGSSTVWPRVIERSNLMTGIDVRTQEDPYLPTDAIAFYQAGVPTISFFTGSHEDYHRPSDSADKIDYEGLVRIADFAGRFASNVLRMPNRPDYVEVERTGTSGGDRDSVRAFTGTIPDYTTEVEGLRLSGVIGGGPADLAGLREGDVIVKFGASDIANIYDYTYALDAVKIDEPVNVVVLRDGERMEFVVTPTSRK